MGYFGNFGAGSSPTLLSLLSALGAGGSTLGGLHGWLDQLFGRTGPGPVMQPGSGAQMMFPANPATGYYPPPMQASPGVNPAGSMLLTPGGPAGGTDVGGQPAAPSVGDMGPNYNWGNLGLPMWHPLNQALLAQGMSAANAGPTPAAMAGTQDALSRAAAYHAALLGGSP